MKQKLIAGNWKMNKTPSQAQVLVKELIPLVKDSKQKVMIAPAYVCLPAVAELIKGTNIMLAAQDVSQYEEGAYTGEISVSMLKDIGVSAVILGHSERRQYHAETDTMVNTKLTLCLQHDLCAIVCVGETLEERESGKAFDVVKHQMELSLKGIDKKHSEKIIIAYEPVWAIGTGKTASSAQAEEVHAHIRQILIAQFGKENADKMIIQYGGSVKPDNVKELMSMPNIDGALVGGASLKADSFASLATY